MVLSDSIKYIGTCNKKSVIPSYGRVRAVSKFPPQINHPVSHLIIAPVCSIQSELIAIGMITLKGEKQKYYFSNSH
jgi:hypothetical protein